MIGGLFFKYNIYTILRINHNQDYVFHRKSTKIRIST
jgi:hypothetical protein